MYKLEGRAEVSLLLLLFMHVCECVPGVVVVVAATDVVADELLLWLLLLPLLFVVYLRDVSPFSLSLSSPFPPPGPSLRQPLFGGVDDAINDGSLSLVEKRKHNNTRD